MAYFDDSNLRGANLNGANLKEAYFTGAMLFKADLRKAIGIDTIRADWIDIGPEGAPQKLEGEEVWKWFRNAAGHSSNGTR